MDDVVLGKKESIERCIRQIRMYYAADSGVPFDEDYMKQDAIALNIQRAAELCIDMANHAVKILKLGIPKESREGFRLLADAGHIDPELAHSLGRMVGFRNVLIHDYRSLDLEILQGVVENRLDTFFDFTNAILEI